jgi:hypothetical protein
MCWGEMYARKGFEGPGSLLEAHQNDIGSARIDPKRVIWELGHLIPCEMVVFLMIGG